MLMTQCLSSEFVPGLSQGDGRLRYRAATGGISNGLFLYQGALDSACGLYALMMGLMLTHGVSRSVAIRSLGRTGPRTSQFRELAASTFFTGTTASQLVELAEAFLPNSLCEELPGSHRRLITGCIDELFAGNPVALAVADKTYNFRHWLLLVGTEFNNRKSRYGRLPSDVTALLALDSNGELPSISPCNARLEMCDTQSMRLRCLNGFNLSVTAIGAVRFGRPKQIEKRGRLA